MALRRCVAAFVIVTAGCLVLAGLAPALWGWRPYLVTSGSMEPLVHPGDVVVIDPDTAPGPGSVITFRRGAETITHRVVGRNDDGSYVTQGDAAEFADPGAVRPDQVVGTVRMLVPLVGWPALRLRQDPVGTALGAFLAVGVLALLWRHSSTGRHRARGGRTPLAAANCLILAAALVAVWPTKSVFTAQSAASSSFLTHNTFYPYSVLATNPVSYWRLGEAAGSTTAADAKGVSALSNLGGATFGQAGYRTADPNTAVRLPSTTSRLSATAVAAHNLTGSFTIQAWVKAAAIPNVGTGRVMAKYNGSVLNFLLAFDSAGRAMRMLVDTSVTRYTATATWPTDGKWHLATGVYNGSTLAYYQDGALANSVAATGTPQTVPTTPVTVGYTTSSLNGYIDEVTIWNRALSAAEIANLYALATG